MPDDLWRMPRGWPFATLALTRGGLIVGRRDQPPRLLPWRLLRRVARPGGGVAYLRLAEGAPLELPDDSPDDAARLCAIAAAAQVASAAPATAADYASVALAFQHEYGAVQRTDGDAAPRAGCGVALPCAAAVVLGRLGVGWGRGLAAWLAGRVDRALRRDARRAAAPAGRVTAYQVTTAGLRFTLADGTWRDVPLAQVRTVRVRGATTWLHLDGAAPLVLNGVQAPLVELVRAVQAVRSARFEGIDAQPPRASALSRATGPESGTDERGISVAAGGSGDGCTDRAHGCRA